MTKPSAGQAAPQNDDLPALAFDDVSVAFRESGGRVRQVLRSVSFALTANQFTVLVGPSGCGKTTLLQLAIGLATPTGGRVASGGRTVHGLQEGIGYVTQQASLFPWYTLAQNVELPLLLRKVPAPTRRQRVAEYLELAGLTGFEDHFPYQLSGGMQKRASIVRTLIYSPPIVLMDEPFGSLDAQTKMVMQDYLLRLWTEHKTTVLFITHDLTEAVALADNVVLLSSQPTVVKQNQPISIRRPRNVFEPYSMEGFVEAYQTLWDGFRSELTPVAGTEPGGPVAPR